ncbi:MAG TPA: protein-export chaperone SecB [Bacteroidales bacterium]|nr:protein-export chaperone SecB [Bacteroidales bacterium]
MENSKFQFKGFNIIRSLIEKKDARPAQKMSLSFNPRGLINKDESNFQLQLSVKIGDENNVINIEIEAVANYSFDQQIGVETLDKLFYVNAPALLFPYIRAYISTLTNLSGFEPVNLPTLNMTKLGSDLKKNTKEA